ncbi:MAG: alpha/beta hydrolase [Thermoguttaceae bacterium]|nr:alpha/beta hydrolase [Thermoguttaceae bacterium]
MKRLLLLLVILGLTSTAWAQEQFSIWDGPAPGEKDVSANPTLLLYQPENKTTDSCLIVFPGGGYNHLAKDHEGDKIAKYFNSKGMTVAVLWYRIPRRPGVEKHRVAWQDAQRAVRFVRSHADEWKINAEKIGVLGFSAGGHLTLMVSTSSQTPAYEPVDDLDKTPCYVNFAVPVYPAYVLERTDKGYTLESKIVDEFAFDAKTPPMCFIHGDDDVCPSMASAVVYAKLKSMGIPAELHIFAKTGHGFGAKPKDNHVGDWLNRVYEWMKVMGYAN